ncbi:flagellar export protein FliJ [Megalodesulfovibrio paquesii]
MAPFRFSLQRVLDIRQQQEEQARLEMAQAQARYQKQVAVTEAARSKLAFHKDYWLQRCKQGVNKDDFWLNQMYTFSLERDVQAAESVMLQLAKELNAKRRALVERAKAVKLLEKLKLRQGIRHAEEEQIQERKQLDETATIRFKHADL